MNLIKEKMMYFKSIIDLKVSFKILSQLHVSVSKSSKQLKIIECVIKRLHVITFSFILRKMSL